MGNDLSHLFIWAAMLINLGVSVWALVVVTLNWESFSVYVKRWKFALIAYTFSITFLTGEVIRKGLPVTGYRYVLLTLASLYLVYTLWANHSHNEE